MLTVRTWVAKREAVVDAVTVHLKFCRNQFEAVENSRLSRLPRILIGEVFI